jgi:17beta-estradiol 17-dehydrogenase / very-long-chain 3-oxoacyl-CoA reductase
MEGSEPVLPWLLNYFFVFVGAVSLLKALKLLFLFVADEFKSVDLTRFGVGSWAVVTGASDGIGKGFAEELASRGFNIYQISNVPDRLKTCEDALTSKYKVQVISRDFDFTKCSTDLATLTSILAKDLEGKDVSILVNNVGTSEKNIFVNLSKTDVKNVILLNCFPIVYMTRLLMPKLQQRQLPSAVINLSSVASLKPTHGLAVYASSKKFDDCLTVNLASNPGNVTYMSLKPGFVLTPLTADIVEPKHLEISANECASAALRDLGSHLSFVGHYKHKCMAQLLSWAPEGKQDFTPSS